MSDKQDLIKTLNYFKHFQYLPDFEQIYTFFPKNISQKSLKQLFEANKYTVGEYSKNSKTQISNLKTSRKKLNNWVFKTYIKALRLLPQIKLVGLSGSIAMMNAEKDDDIDLFIITNKSRLFTGRFLATAIAFIMGLKRSVGLKKAPDKVCLNLFFDEADLTVPKTKKTEFVAHEVLQMKPLVNKYKTYERFLQANKWVLKYFPNVSKISNQFQISKFKNYKLNKNFKFQISNLGDWVESFLKNLQLKLINRHRTTEIITDFQLWFHPEDFGKKVKT